MKTDWTPKKADWFGRIPSEDARDYPLGAPPLEKVSRQWRYWYSAGVLNQGPTPHCVAYSGVKWLSAGPLRNTPITLSPIELYNACQQVDEWPGTAYAGTSVRALFKVLKREGFVAEYRRTADVHALAAHVIERGPLVVGTTWYARMSEPGADGILHPDGAAIGGHAYVVIGVNLDRGVFRILNSWGDWWGDGGRAWISLPDMDGLLRDHGEAFTATEVCA